MTRGGYTDKSTERKVKQAERGVQSLARRPAPLPPVAGATPWLLLNAYGQTLPGDAGFDPLKFDELAWDPSLVNLNPADPEDGSDDIFFVDKLTFGGTDYWQPGLRLLSSTEGWYEFEVAVDVGDTGDGAPSVFWEASVHPTSGGGSFPNTFHWNEKFIWNGTDQMQEMFQRTWRLWATAQRSYQVSVRQNTGVDKDLAGWMMIRYLGQLGGFDDNSEWEFAYP